MKIKGIVGAVDMTFRLLLLFKAGMKMHDIL